MAAKQQGESQEKVDELFPCVSYGNKVLINMYMVVCQYLIQTDAVS